MRLGGVDFLRKSLKVSRQVQRVNGGAIDVRAPKYGSERVVFLADSLVGLLAEHVATCGSTGEDQWLFAGEATSRRTRTPSATGGARPSGTRACQASSSTISGTSTPPAAAGCDVVTVQRSLGHPKATTTLNTYAHLWPTAEDRTRKAAELIMSASLGHEEAPELADDVSRRYRS